nr:immunoglobulin light chain junction region [Macaca mulatta]
CFQGSHLPFTF